MKDVSLWSLTNSADIKQKLTISAHLNEAGYRGVETKVQQCFLYLSLEWDAGNLKEVIERHLLCTALLLGLLNIIGYNWLQEKT